MVEKEITAVKRVSKNGTSLSLNVARECRKIGADVGDKVCISIALAPKIKEEKE